MRRIFALALSAVIGLTSSSCQPDNEENISWKTKWTPEQPKGHNEYDVIIAGSGLGGLSCGALLSKAGYKVLVLEKNARIGGFASGYEKDGFLFGYGPEDIEGICERGPVSHLLDELKLDQNDLFVPNSRKFLLSNASLDVGTEPNAFIAALMTAFPNERDNIDKFFSKAKSVYSEAFDKEMIQYWGIRLPQQLMHQVMPKTWNEAYEKTHQNLIEWQTKSFQVVLDEHFSDPQIKQLLCSTLNYLGALSFKTPAAIVVARTYGYFFFGGYHALQSTQHFASVIGKYIEENGGNIYCNHTVDQILIQDHQVYGVQVGETIFQAPVIVANVNAKTLYTDLVDSAALSPKFLEHIRKLPMSSSAFSVHLGVDEDLSQYPAIIRNKDNQLNFTNSSRNDPTVAPAGKSAVIIREPARYEDFLNRSQADYEHYVQQRSKALIEKWSTHVPELAHSRIIETVLTPPVFEELDGMPQGAVYGFDTSYLAHRPYFKSPIRGLYLASATSGGPGVADVVTNGILCYNDIVGWKLPK